MSAQTTSSFSRRDFLKGAGAVIGLFGLGSLVGVPAEASSGEANPDAWGTLVDLTRCAGCNRCALACKSANNLPDPETVPHRLDSSAYTFVESCKVQCQNEEDDTCHVKRQCMHCLHPACASACTVSALRKTAAGPVIYESDKCIGCRYCQYACPFGVPAYDWANPLGLIHKCQFCASRLAEGEQPACTAACPTGAIQFGKRSDLLVQAHARIQSNPGRYIDHVYGEHEVGGTSMLYISSVPFEDLGFAKLDENQVSRYAEWTMNKTPFVALTVATVSTGAHFLLKNRGHTEHEAPTPESESGDRP